MYYSYKIAKTALVVFCLKPERKAYLSYMDLLSKKISKLIFKRNINRDIEQISMDAYMLKVFAKIDGIKDAATVASELGLSMIELKNVLSKLFKLNLILKGKKSVPTVKKDFFDFMESELADAIGPMARVVISDVVNELGETIDLFPINRLTELLEKISSKLFVGDQKRDFVKVMLKNLESIGA